MKLVAKKNFANVPALALPADDLEHPAHVHKGFRFNIGTGATLIDLKQAERVLVSQLVVSKSAVADDGTPASKAAIAKIDAEVKEEEELEARLAKKAEKQLASK